MVEQPNSIHNTPDAVLDTHCYGAVDLYSIQLQSRFDSYRGNVSVFNALFFHLVYQCLRLETVGLVRGHMV